MVKNKTRKKSKTEKKQKKRFDFKHAEAPLGLKEIEEKLAVVCQGYSEKFGIDCTEDWFLLKLQEELGELVSAHLKLTQRARPGKKTSAEREQNLREEIADVLAMVLLYARARKIDVDEALADKWFRYLERQK